MILVQSVHVVRHQTPEMIEETVIYFRIEENDDLDSLDSIDLIDLVDGKKHQV